MGILAAALNNKHALDGILRVSTPRKAVGVLANQTNLEMFSRQLLQKQALPAVPRQRAPSLAQGGSHSEWSVVIGSRRMARSAGI